MEEDNIKSRFEKIIRIGQQLYFRRKKVCTFFDEETRSIIFFLISVQLTNMATYNFLPIVFEFSFCFFLCSFSGRPRATHNGTLLSL